MKTKLAQRESSIEPQNASNFLVAKATRNGKTAGRVHSSFPTKCRAKRRDAAVAAAAAAAE